MLTSGYGGTAAVEHLFRFALFGGVFYAFLTYADAFGHIEDCAVLGDAVKNGGGEVAVIDKRTPLIETELGGDDGAAFLMAHLHKIEEETGLDFIKRSIPHFIDEEAVDGCKPFQYLFIAAICKRCVQLPQQVFEVNETAVTFVIDCMNEIRGSQTGFSAAGGPD